MIIGKIEWDTTTPMASRRRDDSGAEFTPRDDSDMSWLGALIMLGTLAGLIALAMWKGIAFVVGGWLVAASVWAIVMATESSPWRAALAISVGILGLAIGLVMMGVAR